MRTTVLIVGGLGCIQALTTPPLVTGPAGSRGQISVARRSVLAGGAATLLGFSTAAVADEPEQVTLPNGLKYKVLSSGPTGGGKPIVGDLIAIRFKATVQGSNAVIDDILNNPEPYYYRAGSGQVVPAVEQAVLMMRSGDKWALEVPPTLGFGTKGRSSRSASCP
jgi:hypothetical protein